MTVVDRPAMTATQAARRLGCSSRTVYKMVEAGEIGHIRVRTLIRIRKADLLAYEATQWHAPAPSAPATVSPCAPVVSMSRGGRTADNDAFRRGQMMAAKDAARKAT